MVDLRGFSLPEQHLLPDVVVAFVDGELSPLARQRAAAHFERCAQCAAELSTQRQARTAVRSAETPGMPAGLLAALRAIPTDTHIDTGLPAGPEALAMTADGQLVAVQRPDRVAGLGAGSAVLGSSTPLGHPGSTARLGDSRLGSGERLGRGDSRLGSGESRLGGSDGPLGGSDGPLGSSDGPLGGGESRLGGGAETLGGGDGVWRVRFPLGRRGVQGAGVVAVGLVLGALAVVGSHVAGAVNDLPTGPSTAGGSGGAQVVEANFGPGGAVTGNTAVNAADDAGSASANSVPAGSVPVSPSATSSVLRVPAVAQARH